MRNVSKSMYGQYVFVGVGVGVGMCGEGVGVGSTGVRDGIISN